MFHARAKKNRGAAANKWLPRPCFAFGLLFVRQNKLHLRKIAVRHAVQLADHRVGNPPHIPVHIGKSALDSADNLRPAIRRIDTD